MDRGTKKREVVKKYGTFFEREKIVLWEMIKNLIYKKYKNITVFSFFLNLLLY